LTKEKAAALLAAKDETLSPFDVLDWFNNDNRIEGWICRQSDHRYGALLIWRVNGELTDPQIVWCTPKLRYPFGRCEQQGGGRRYHWPEGKRSVEVYRKLDGTNVCAYSYSDASGQRFITYKTRLTPVIMNGKYGAFRDMWAELLQGDELRKIANTRQVEVGNVAVSFEMYGYRNPHLIVSAEPLAAKALFVVNQATHGVYPANQFFGASDAVLPLAAPIVSMNPDEMIADYEARQAEAEAQNTEFAEGDEKRIEGTEGFVYYVHDADEFSWDLYKCKPPGIERIHWTSDTIPESIIAPTARNALESCEGELTAAYVRELLLEEFSVKQVNASHARVARIVEALNKEIAWIKRVSEAYASCGETFDEGGKRKVMRALSLVFDGSEMKGVYSALRQIGAVKE